MARPFRFKLETVLKLRKQKEDQHKRMVAERLRQLNAARRHLVHIEDQTEWEIEAVRAGRGRGTVSVQNLARGRHWLTHLQRSLLEAQGQIRVVEGRLARERAQLARAAKEAKALEKLRERQAQRYAAEEKRLDRRELDEVAVLHFTRRRSLGQRSVSQARRRSRRQAETVSLQE